MIFVMPTPYVEYGQPDPIREATTVTLSPASALTFQKRQNDYKKLYTLNNLINT